MYDRDYLMMQSSARISRKFATTAIMTAVREMTLSFGSFPSIERDFHNQQRARLPVQEAWIGGLQPEETDTQSSSCRQEG